MKIVFKFAFFAVALGFLMLEVSRARAVELEDHWFISGNQIGSWQKPLVKPPKGWVEDEEWTQGYERLVLFEGGDKSRSKPIMYVRAHLADDMTLDDYIKGAQERWLEKLRDSTIEAQPDFARSGRPLIKVYMYRNPSQPEQAFELTAFVKDTDSKDPKRIVFLQVVVAAPSVEALDAAKPAFLELLGNL